MDVCGCFQAYYIQGRQWFLSILCRFTQFISDINEIHMVLLRLKLVSQGFLPNEPVLLGSSLRHYATSSLGLTLSHATTSHISPLALVIFAVTVYSVFS